MMVKVPLEVIDDVYDMIKKHNQEAFRRL